MPAQVRQCWLKIARSACADKNFSATHLSAAQSIWAAVPYSEVIVDRTADVVL